RLLSIIAFQSAQIIENARLAGKEKELQEIEQDLMVARQIQINLLPKVMPEISGFDIYGASIPSKQVGGDYFDFIKLPYGNLGVVIGDVSGKGTPAALLMANLQATLRSQALSSGEPKVLVKNSNSLLNQSMEQGKFVTLVYGRLNPSDKSFAYVNAGHNSPYLFSDGRVEELKAGGLILGVMPGVEYQQGSVTLRPKDVLVLFTDGVTEANNETDAFFEDERLLQVIKSNLNLSSRQLADKIVEEVRHFQGMQSQSDDITLVVIRAI
ncbi:MAG: PP2C family protein-serine/threonine phosphatase, partial [candidate division Zixibacteria bacterium]|nr:PP2C family protein-serine/threonine phosphatase [candidate division Zixibacteria bacterium]